MLNFSKNEETNYVMLMKFRELYRETITKYYRELLPGIHDFVINSMIKCNSEFLFQFYHTLGGDMTLMLRRLGVYIPFKKLLGLLYSVGVTVTMTSKDGEKFQLYDEEERYDLNKKREIAVHTHFHKILPKFFSIYSGINEFNQLNGTSFVDGNILKGFDNSYEKLAEPLTVTQFLILTEKLFEDVEFHFHRNTKNEILEIYKSHNCKYDPLRSSYRRAMHLTRNMLSIYFNELLRNEFFTVNYFNEVKRDMNIRDDRPLIHSDRNVIMDTAPKDIIYGTRGVLFGNDHESFIRENLIPEQYRKRSRECFLDVKGKFLTNKVEISKRLEQLLYQKLWSDAFSESFKNERQFRRLINRLFKIDQSNYGGPRDLTKWNWFTIMTFLSL